MLRGRRRARGRRDVAIGDETVPMRATKGCQCPSCRRQRRAHPRSRGENLPMEVIVPCSQGSSPLTRGKHGQSRRGSDRRRLIPAHAGKTPPMSCPPTSSGAHPRSRGENTTAALIGALVPGSSPLTRGKRRGRPCRTQRRGLIPAHAGKTGCQEGRKPAGAAHPRSRGENRRDVSSSTSPSGSSPLTRGKLFLTCTFIA